jgi:hypothetical protein
MIAHKENWAFPVTALVHSAPAKTKMISEGIGMQAEVAIVKTMSAK